jgi:hypothetical protein
MNQFRATSPTKTKQIASKSIDPELLEPKYNELRRPSLPYGIVINDKPAGILIPTEQLEKAEWQQMPSPEELTTIELTEEVTGLLLSKCRILLLAFVPEYVRWKDLEENGDKIGTFVAPYEEYRYLLDKKTQEVCSEHALVFLDNSNRPLHKVPIVVRFKNVALWSFKAAREKYYQALEKVFAEYYDLEYCGKNDKWRSLGVLNLEFQAIKEGEGKNQHYCCKTYRITTPTLENLPKLFLGNPRNKKQIWKLHEAIAGFSELTNEQLPALASSVEEVSPDVRVLPPEKGDRSKKARRLKRVTNVEIDRDGLVDEYRESHENFDFDFE